MASIGGIPIIYHFPNPMKVTHCNVLFREMKANTVDLVQIFKTHFSGKIF